MVLADPTVSRYHAALRREGNDWILIDVDSKNSTAVNGWRVTHAPVGPGDRISLGRSRFVLSR